MRILKRIVEMIFIFVLPILLLLCTFKKSYVYDSNNNLISQRIEFNSNIFSISEGDISYFYYEYYDLDAVIDLLSDDSIMINYNVSPFVSQINNNVVNDFIFVNYNDNFYYISISNDSINTSPNWDVEYLDNNVTVIRFNSPASIINKYGNIIKDIHSLTIRDNIINKGLNIIFGYFGISENIVLQLLVVYVLLMLIMLLIWYVIYVPFDMLFGLLLRKLEYYR